MHPNIRTVAVSAALLSAVATASQAGSSNPPTSFCSTVGTFIRLGTADASGEVLASAEKTIVVRDFGCVPVPASTVEIRFSACTSAGEFRLCSTQSYPGMGLDCATNTVWAMTDASGIARFRVRGHALNPGPAGTDAPGPGLGDAPCAEVRADGVLLGHLRVKAYDHDGSAGLSPIDLSLFLADRFRSTCTTYPRPSCDSYRSRSDYNDDGTINPADLSLFLAARFSAAGSRSCPGASCAP